ncbi:MAG: AAA family ATPase, partial [Acidimicrobiales bacterium]
MQADTRIQLLLGQLNTVIVGKPQQVSDCVACLLAGGHLLIEDVPGVGKTTLAHALARSFGLQFSRVQFTADLMPSDLVGVSIYERGREDFVFHPGPVFAQVLLADEINRASPKTQSALLEVMQEHSVTVGKKTHQLQQPYFVLATQNPLEMEGTYPLPEAQLDRFMFKVMVPFPSEDDLVAIMDRTTGADTPTASKICSGAEIVEMQRLARAVPIAPHVTAYAVSVLAASHPDQPRAPELVRQYV